MDTHVNTEEENISEMGAKVDDQTRPAAHNFKRSKLQPTTNCIESLPDDVVFDILARVPAADIYSAIRLVCRKWYQTTRTHDFVRAHLQQSTCGLLIARGRSRSDLFATQNGPNIEISHFAYNSTSDAVSSCNGLVLEYHPKEPKHAFRITNPTTKQHLVLPSIDKRSAYAAAAGLAYAVASKEYKVVRPICASVGVLECLILAVGVDEDWERRVDIQHLSPSARDLLRETPWPTDGFVHWAQNGGGCRDSEYVVTLNVETEMITQFPAVPPSLCRETKLLYRYLPMGSCLSLLIGRGNYKFPIWDQVWVMKPETGEWTKVMSIDSESQKRALQGVLALNHMLRPVGWLKFQEVLVFSAANRSSGTQICIAYNVRTHEIESHELGFNPYTFLVHRHSLLWLDGC